MDTQHIIGRLTPANPEALTERTYKHIYNGVVRNNLNGIVFAPNWETGELRVDNRTPNASEARTCDSALDLISRVSGLINSVGLSELKLQGEITVIIPTTNPVVFKLVIGDNKVLYKQAQLHWDELARPV